MDKKMTASVCVEDLTFLRRRLTKTFQRAHKLHCFLGILAKAAACEECAEDVGELLPDAAERMAEICADMKEMEQKAAEIGYG